MKPSTHRLLIGIFASFLAMAVFSAVPAFAATITVTSLADSGPGSLRDSIATASSGDTINFGITGTITLTSGELLISNNLTISGPGASSLAISGNNSSRVFNIAGGAVALSGLTIQNASGDIGGGIYTKGTLIVTSSTLSGNRANFGGAIYNGAGTLIVTNSTLFNNSASADNSGGGISNDTGMLTVTNSTLSGNAAPYAGGIYNSGTLTVTNSTLSGNSASQLGGGIWNTKGGTLNVTNSTLSGNRANFGGGIYAGGGTLTITNSTFAGNSASSGGGILNDTGTLVAKSTIVANSPSGGNCYLLTGTPTSQGHNLSDDATCSSFFTQTGDLNSTPAGLDPNGLQNNGGFAPTIALLASSPAVAAIPLTPTNYCTDVNGAPVTTDQRGVTRPQQGPACDIGAYELIPDNDSQFSQLNGGNTFSGNQTVNGNVNATSFVGSGAGLTGVTAANSQALGGVPASNFARLDIGNLFSGNQTIGGNVTANAFVGNSASFSSGLQASSGTGAAIIGNSPTGDAVVGFTQNGIGVLGAASSGAGVAGSSTSGPGVFGYTSAAGATTAAGLFNNLSSGNILLGQSNGVTKFSVNGKGDVAASGSVTIGGGTPILEHLSQTLSVSVPPISTGQVCTLLGPYPFSGASDGDTIALGVPSSFMTIPNVFLSFVAWVGPSNNQIYIRVCNSGSKNNAVSGPIRVDIWKH